MRKHLHKKKPCQENLVDIPYNELLQHIPELRQTIREKTYKCNSCSKSFTTPQGKSRHQRHFCKGVLPSEPTNVRRLVEETVHEVLAQPQNVTINNMCIKPNITDNRSSSDVKMKALENVVERLQLEVAALKERKNEAFYQQCMETFKFPGSSHCRLSCGITDITTDTIHAEIKAFDCWKEAVGQLMAYNVEAPRDELQVYLFGGRSKNSGAAKKEVADVFQKLGIRAFELKSTADEFIIVNMADESIETFPYCSMHIEDES